MRSLLVSALLLASPLLLAAQEKGAWTAESSNAKAITGDVIFSENKIGIALVNFPIAQIRELKPEEASAAFDAEAGGAGHLYRLGIAANQRFLHKNTLCGSEEVEWMATYVQGRKLRLAFFSNPKPPVFTFEALNNSPDLCGSFTYGR
ncbi:hypothetical protein DYQ86_06125 [Acidobacteria bacterium AB60]|nr:hypothetical protein DYQ86_06125 [Acidobacteria bacterium AB60]